MRYYDQVGLLKPTGYSDAGRRLYSEADFARLQQILTLKLIGLSLGEIGQVLAMGNGETGGMLARQRHALEQQVSRLQAVIDAIDRVQQTMQKGQPADIDRVIAIIQAVTMSTQTDWFEQFLTAGQRERLAAHHALQPVDEAKQTGEAWQALFQDIMAALDREVSSAEARARGALGQADRAVWQRRRDSRPQQRLHPDRQRARH